MKKHALSISLIAIIILLDQASKYFVLLGEVGTIYVTNFLNIVNVWNDGIAFGFFSGADSNLFFIFSTIIVALVFGYLLLRAREDGLTLAYSLIVGGALGNLIDRFTHKAVFDFIDFHLADFHWPAFNIADSAICIGGALLIWHFIFANKAIKKNRHRSLAFIALALFSLASINSCNKKSLGLNRDLPDESNVSRRPDLSIPPSFNLPEPVDEELSSQEKAPQKHTKASAKEVGLTQADQASMNKFGNGKK